MGPPSKHPEVSMDIVVVGRHAELPEKFRRHVEEKLVKVEQLAPRAQRIDVEVTHENNPRLAGIRERVELTVVDSGPVVRAEATADDRYAAGTAASQPGPSQGPPQQHAPHTRRRAPTAARRGARAAGSRPRTRGS